MISSPLGDNSHTVKEVVSLMLSGVLAFTRLTTLGSSVNLLTKMSYCNIKNALIVNSLTAEKFGSGGFEKSWILVLYTRCDCKVPT